MQNAKCQLLWNDKMQNDKIFMGVFSFIQNVKFFMGRVRAFWLFGFFWPLEAKIQNGFVKNFPWCLVPFCKMMDQNPKFFG
jgi:hypothetical protein